MLPAQFASGFVSGSALPVVMNPPALPADMMAPACWETCPVRMMTDSELSAVLGGLPGTPRVVVSGNHATPWHALTLLDVAVAEYRLFALNAQPGIPDRPGVVPESPFIGPGMRGRD